VRPVDRVAACGSLCVRVALPPTDGVANGRTPSSVPLSAGCHLHSPADVPRTRPRASEPATPALGRDPLTQRPDVQKKGSLAALGEGRSCPRGERDVGEGALGRERDVSMFFRILRGKASQSVLLESGAFRPPQRPPNAVLTGSGPMV
jgi:hypothetical protein